MGLTGLLGITSTLRIYDGENFSVMCRNSCLALQKILILTILPKSPDLDSESVSCSVVSDSLGPRGLCSLSGSSVHKIFQARILEWVAMPSSRGSSDSGIKPRSPALQADSQSFLLDLGSRYIKGPSTHILLAPGALEPLI